MHGATLRDADAVGALAIFITGRSEAELIAGAEHLAVHHDEMAIPPPGWHTMIAAHQ